MYMNSLFLSPRSDLFRIMLPKELIPKEIYEKWYNIINSVDKNFFRNPEDIINESIQSVELTGISEGGIEQEQPARNSLTGRVEPIHKTTYRATTNPLDQMSNELTITFRHTQGFYNYFLLFESWFWHHAKTTTSDFTPFLILEILGEDGRVMSHVKLVSPVFVSIDTLSLSFNKAERSQETFSCTFKYSDIDFDLGPGETIYASSK